MEDVASLEPSTTIIEHDEGAGAEGAAGVSIGDDDDNAHDADERQHVKGVAVAVVAGGMAAACPLSISCMERWQMVDGQQVPHTSSGNKCPVCIGAPLRRDDIALPHTTGSCCTTGVQWEPSVRAARRGFSHRFTARH